jgi:RsiW-degrading membrane proteinase PrsW (M82 family)
MLAAAAKSDWWTYWWLAPLAEYERFAWGPAMLAMFTGCCWFVFTLQAGQVNASRGARWWLCALAVVLGALSIWPTDFLIVWQERQWGIAESDALTAGIRFFVLGVGLREEFSKLLLLLPLIPWLVKRGNELETLIIAACVGLGFALVENSQYFKASLGASSIGRFLTANFFHMAATGIVGLAVVRGLREPRTRGPEALAIFGVIVFAHGLYDAAMSLPALAEYSMASMIIYILLAYQFFHELRNLRIRQQETISLTANFLCGVSLIAAVTFIYLSGQIGCRTAAVMLVPELLSTALMVYMFLREMPGSLVVR